MEEKPKLVKLEPKENEVYINPECLAIVNYLTEMIPLVGCSELHVSFLDAEMNGYIECTTAVSTTMLGNLTMAVHRYERDLDEESEEI